MTYFVHQKRVARPMPNSSNAPIITVPACEFLAPVSGSKVGNWGVAAATKAGVEVKVGAGGGRGVGVSSGSGSLVGLGVGVDVGSGVGVGVIPVGCSISTGAVAVAGGRTIPSMPVAPSTRAMLMVFVTLSGT